jgi:alcohol dehydrogenase class IV
VFPLQINEELLSSNNFFDLAAHKDQLKDFLNFNERRVLCGIQALDELGAECRRLNARRLMLVRDPGVAALETLVRNFLPKDEFEIVSVFDGIVPNPTAASITQLATALRSIECDAVIALGGGSTLDTSKTGLCVASNDAKLEDLFGFDRIAAPARWPLIALPTTAGTGAEASRVAVIATPTGKQAVYSDFLTPKVALVDPRLTMNLPPLLTAISGLDALGHALECTASTKSNALGDAVAREALLAGSPYLVRAIENGAQDPEARYQMARCALLAGLLLSPINTGAAHALGYGIEKLSHQAGTPVPHGTAVALVLPGVIAHNAPAVADKYYYAAGVAGIDLQGKSRETAVAGLAHWIDDLRRQYTPHPNLQAAGLGTEHIPQMVEIALGIRRLLDPNPVPLTHEQATDIYHSVLH